MRKYYLRVLLISICVLLCGCGTQKHEITTEEITTEITTKATTEEVATEITTKATTEEVTTEEIIDESLQNDTQGAETTSNKSVNKMEEQIRLQTSGFFFEDAGWIYL